MRKFSLFILLLLVAVMTFAAPARRRAVKVTQSDGTELTVVLTGDEALHFYTTLDGKPLVKEANGDYHYATFSPEGQFVSAKCLAHEPEARTPYEMELLASVGYSQMMESIGNASKARSAKFRAAAQKAGSQIRPEGDVNIAVVLVQFKDVKFTYTKEDIGNVLNTEGYKLENPFAESVGSARDYFIAQSDGKFRPNFMVTDIITLDNDMSYYGGNDANGDDKKASYAVKEGIMKADATFDFSKCDNNGDGEVEFIYCIYAGYSESYGADDNTIWPHQWELSAQAGTVTVDGVKCNTYACSGELVYSEDYESEIGKVLAGIGLICHEFSHCLGLHDIYDTTYSSGNWGMDYWDVMDQGNYAAEGYVPVGYSAYQRDFCGWRDLVVLEEKGDYSMKPLTQGGIGYKIVNDANPNEYYILENRMQEAWDTFLFNSGMLVVHVDYSKSAWDNNTINTTKNHPRYTLIPADGKLDVYGEVSTQQFVASLKGDVWPGTSGNTELTDTSIPAAKVYTGGYMSKPVRGIEYANGIISFNFMGGMFPDVEVLPATSITATSFVANWNAVEGAEAYNVELYKVTAAGTGAGDAETLLSEDFTGCTKTNTDVSSTIGECTSVSGWDGEKIYSEGGILRIGASSSAGYVTTPVLNADGTVEVSFSTGLYNTKDTGVRLTVTVMDSNEGEVAVKEIVPAAELASHTITAEVNGYFYVEFSTAASSGKKRANIDNVVISSRGSVASELVAEAVVNGTGHLFENLEAGYSYRYRVQAVDAYGVSPFSAYQDVSLPTGVEEVTGDDPNVEVYTLSGVKVYSGAKDGVNVAVPGIYLLKSGPKARKVLIR